MKPKSHNNCLHMCLCLVVLVNLLVPLALLGQDPWATYEGTKGPGAGKHIVLISGDEEYRSEEALVQLAKILAQHHGFRCTVLFAIDPETGVINPNIQNNIPGLEALKSADLMVLFTRFRGLPNAQMQCIDDYLKRGGPVLGIRTSTHAFLFRGENPWAHYGNGYRGPNSAWADGFGRLVLGEKWINHHGSHKHESTRGIIAPDADRSRITCGIRDGDIWGPTDVYGVRLPLPGDSVPVVLGQVVTRSGQFDAEDPFFGMRPDDGPPVEGKKNNPMMPIAWTKTYQIPGGQKGRVFASTIGAATDLVSEGTRRLLVNGAYWAMGLEDKIPTSGTKVDVVGNYKPTAYGSHPNEYWNQLALKPQHASKRVVIITGRDYPGHKWKETSPVLADLLREDRRLQVDVVEQPSFLASPKLAEYDTIVLHFMDWEQPDPGPAARKNLRALVRKGKGLVLVHFACGAFQDWPEFATLAGRAWDPELRGHDPHGKFRVDIIDKIHPVTQGMTSFDTVDELYTCLAGDRPIHLLATARSKVDQKDYPMAFVLNEGKGQVFHCVLGHDVQAFEAQGVKDLFRRGCAWTAGLSPAQP